jgi:hypothetical protein
VLVNYKDKYAMLPTVFMQWLVIAKYGESDYLVHSSLLLNAV